MSATSLFFEFESRSESGSLNFIKTKLENIKKQLEPTFMDKFLLEQFEEEKAIKYKDTLINIFELVLPVIIIISFVTTIIITLVTITYFSYISTPYNTTLQNTIYILASSLIFIVNLFLSVIIIIVLDSLRVKLIGVTSLNKKLLLIEKQKLENKLINIDELA